VFAPSKKAGHMGATDQLFVTHQKVLASGVPSTHGDELTTSKLKWRSADLAYAVHFRLRHAERSPNVTFGPAINFC